jgi:acyl-coenzyme A thioesterase PaaI-like protein
VLTGCSYISAQPDDPVVTARSVVAHMMENDLFSQWLGITVIEVKEGYSKIKMTVRKEMINGFGIVHGGIAFSLSDSVHLHLPVITAMFYQWH